MPKDEAFSPSAPKEAYSRIFKGSHITEHSLITLFKQLSNAWGQTH